MHERNGMRTAPAQGAEVLGHVLIADDEPLLLNSLRRILESSGHTVDTASDGHAALDLINREQFDAIISDISMPGVDGIQLLRAVRERDPDVPVILITGNPAVETAVQGVEHGIAAYMVKPFDLREFQRVIAKAVRLRRLAKLSRTPSRFSRRRSGGPGIVPRSRLSSAAPCAVSGWRSTRSSTGARGGFTVTRLLCARPSPD